MNKWWVAILLLLSGCSGDDAGSVSEADGEYAEAENLAAVNPCGDQGTYDTIREIVFDGAEKIASDDPLALNDLRRSVAVNMKFPVVSDVQDELQRTECTGRLVLGLPPMARNAFDGDSELEADIQYSVQPAADGSGDVVHAEGLEYIIRRIALADLQRASRRLAAAGGPQMQRTYNPSFDCGPGLNNTERMICQDEGLAAQDRELSDAFRRVWPIILALSGSNCLQTNAVHWRRERSAAIPLASPIGMKLLSQTILIISLWNGSYDRSRSPSWRSRTAESGPQRSAPAGTRSRWRSAGLRTRAIRFRR